jgi:murein DD-endopeptidase MepM/ murein hydrolase activator NlpD
MQLDKNGKFVNGDAADVHGYVDYGAQVISVADGVVVGLEDSLEDQKPGTLPDPKTINMGNVDGNHLVIDLGGGVYAFYAHLVKGSIVVKLGDHVKRAQPLAKLGNTGNSSAPHLHFHLMQGPSVLCSNGMPYVIDGFEAAGSLNLHSADEQGFTADFSKNFRPATARHDQYPLDVDIVNFSSPH